MYALTPFFTSKIYSLNNEMSPIRTFVSDRDITYPDPEVIRDGERFTIIENDPEHRYSVSMAHQSKVSFSMDDMKKIPHDMVLSLFRKMTDRDLPFSSFFPRENDGWDSSSPDVICKFGETTYVVEVGTTQGNIMRTFENKRNKYVEAVQRRCGSNWIIIIIIVNHNSVYCNFNLNQEEVNDIVARFNYGKILQQKAKDTGAILDHDDSKSRIKEEIRLNLFEEIYKEDVNTHDFLYMNEESMNDFEQITDYGYLGPVIEDAKDDFKMRTSPEYQHFPIDNYIKDNYLKEDLRTDMKTVVPFPFVLLEPRYDSISAWIDEMPAIQSQGPYANLWNELRGGLQKVITDDEENVRIIDLRKMETTQYNINTAKKYRDDEFATRGRVKITLNFEDSLFFAEAGLNAKKFKDHEILKTKRETTKKGFSWETDTTDIENFISREDLFDYYEEFDNPLLVSLKPLFLNYFGSINEVSSSKFREFLKTKIGMYLTFVSSIASELNINIRKPTNNKEWILTYNRLFGFPMAIKNTGSNKHTFFTILIEKEKVHEHVGLPFSDLISLDDNYYCSKILSTRNHDLSMLVGIITKFYSTYMIFTDATNEKPEISRNFRFNKEVLASLLISMENKEKTSSPLQNVRYMYMDLLTTIPTNSDPFKVITKFDTIIRNRLILYFMKKIVISFKIMLENKKQSDVLLSQYVDADDSDDEEDEDHEDKDFKIPASQDQVNGLISYISMNPLKTYEEALNLSYMGVFHEKDKNEEKQGYFKIFSKVIKEEIKMRPEYCDKHKMGYKPQTIDWNTIRPSSLKSHEFSVPHVKLIGQAIKRKIKSSGMSDSSLQDLILSKLSSVCYEELATFKASAEYKSFTKGDLKYFGYESKKRRKCLSAILSLMDEISATDRCPFVSFKKLFRLFKEYGGLIANLFKKNQLTGIREIFVLYIHARVVVNFVETVSRTICELMPNEYLTKGTEKLNAISSHYNTIASESRYKIGNVKAISETVSDSADATTWCQRFVMPVFSVMFNEIFDFWPSMNNTLQSILNEFTFKRLELPKDLLDLLVKHRDVYSEKDDAMNELQDQFLEQSENNDLNNGFSMFLKNRSNFMQGILHYTSSLVHSGHLTLFSKWVEKMTLIKFGNEVKPITTTLCSSDDATRITTILFKKGNPVLHKRILLFLTFTSSVLRASYPLFTAQLSNEKSTMANLTKVAEFNSVWFFRNTMLTPKIKWAFAAMQYKVSNSPVERQLQDHNLINDLISNGCSTVVANDIQLMCLINHYDCCGLMTMNKNIFYSMLNEICTIKHPIGWFYYLSNPMTSTTLGYQYTKYWNLKKYKNARICEVISRKSLIGETSDIGGRSYSVKMRVGSSHKYFDFIHKEIKTTKEEVESKIRENPEIMFLPVDNIEDEKIRILTKAHAPGAEKSFSFDSGSKQHSMAAYLSNKPCITVASKDEKFKCSLAYLTNYIINMFVHMDDSDFEFTYAQFPQMDLYERLNERLQEYKQVDYTGRLRRIKSKVKLPKSKLENLSPLKDVVSVLWFGGLPRTSRAMYNLSLESYMIEFPWIRNTFEDSMKSFIDQFGDISILEFVSFLLHVEEREPTIEFLHPGRRKTGALNTLVECLTKNYGRKTILAKVSRRKQILISSGEDLSETSLYNKVHNRLSEIETLLSRAKTIYSEQEREAMCTWALSKQNILELEEVTESLLSRLPKKMQTLLLMTCIRKISNPTLKQINLIKGLYKRLNQGMLLWYRQMQKKVDGKYMGPGLVDIIFPNATFTLNIKDDVVTEIWADHRGRVNYYSYEIANVISKSLKARTRQYSETEAIKSLSLEVIGSSGKVRENSKRGTPILPMRQETLISTQIDFKIKLNRSGDLILNVTTGGVTGESLKFTAKHNYDTTEQAPIDIYIKSYNREWFNNKPISPGSLRQLLDDAEEDEDFADWVRIAINSRLMAMGESVSNKTALEFTLQTREEEEMNIDFGAAALDMAEIDMIMGMTMNVEDLNVEEMLTEVAIAEQDTASFLAGTDYIEVENPELFGYNARRPQVTSKTSYFFSCSSFDTIINLFKTRYKKKLSEMYSTGYPSSVKDNALRLVMILGMREEDYEEINYEAEDYGF